MSWMIWSVVGLLLGVVLFLATGVLLGPYVSASKQQWFLDRYVSLAMTALDRGGLVSVSSSGLELVNFERDGSNWKCTIDGKELWYSDPGARMGRLADKPFGLADGDVDRIVSAEDLAVAEADMRASNTVGDTWNYQVEVDRQDGDGTDVVEQTAIRGTATLPETPQVTFHWLPQFVDNSGSPESPDLVDSYIEHALSKLGSRNLVDVMALITAAGAGVGIAWFLADYAPGGAGGGGSTVNIGLQIVGGLMGVVV